CPMCALSLVVAPGAADFAPLVAPRVSGDAAWRELERARRLPREEGAVVVREKRLLLVPFWRAADGGGGGAELISGADLLPVGLPPLGEARRRVAGLRVRELTGTGDAMGRLTQSPAHLEADIVDVTIHPAGESGGSWKLVYYPIWSFHYAVYSKEHRHVVDAASGEPVGPARGIPWAGIAGAAVTVLAIVFAAGYPLLGAAAAVPAWAAALAGMRIATSRSRSV
ncbi:MAG TPA: hypothetical protein VFP98_05320, partial [Candidatus Polarisedimenticolia bacterium]|nr:hypothetical protein [Candidatus Polarisedimenticolia bacterium]